MRDIARYVFSSLIPFLYPNFLSLIPKVWTVMVPDPTDHRSLKKLLIPIPCLVITDSGLWSQIHPSNPWSHPFDPLSLSEKKKRYHPLLFTEEFTCCSQFSWDTIFRSASSPVSHPVNQYSTVHSEQIKHLDSGTSYWYIHGHLQSIKIRVRPCMIWEKTFCFLFCELNHLKNERFPKLRNYIERQCRFIQLNFLVSFPK